jgi:PST family polysaccharide transporter
MAQAYTVVGFAGLVQQGGYKEILIQRQKNFRRWSVVAFWMSLTFALLAASIMLAASPVAARIYRNPMLVGMLAVLALAVPIEAFWVVPSARLNVDLRFRAIAIFAFAASAATMALSVFLAWRGYGPYSFILPRPVVGVVNALLLWWFTRLPLPLKPHFRRWRFMIGDTGLITATWFCFTIITQGDYITLGIFHNADVVGIYYFAFTLSVQTVSILTVNLWGVLTPALAKLSDQPRRQLEAFLAASRMLAVVGIPVSLLVVATADPGIRLFFARKWEPSIHVAEVLSLGITLMLVGAPAISLLQARGQFRTLLKVASGFALIFVAMVTTGAYLGGALSVAIFVAIFYAFYGPVTLYAAIRGIGGTWRDIWSVYTAGLAPAVLSVGIAALIARKVPVIAAHQWAQLAVTSVLSFGLYLLLLRLLSPKTWGELMTRLKSFLPSRPPTAAG